MLSLFIAEPWLALLPGLLFLGLFWRTRRRSVLLASLFWLIYTAYEYGMALRLLCTGECNIRVDLLLIYPALLLMSLWGLAAALRGWRQPRGT